MERNWKELLISNASGRVQKRSAAGQRRSQCEWDQVGDIGRNPGEYCAQKDAYETGQTGNAIYRAETLDTTKRRQENRNTVNETIMLRWMHRVTRKDKIGNEHLRGTTRMVQASKKITEGMSHW